MTAPLLGGGGRHRTRFQERKNAEEKSGIGSDCVRRPLAEEEADARALYLVLAEIGGTELVGPARELAAGTFYRPAAAE